MATLGKLPCHHTCQSLPETIYQTLEASVVKSHHIVGVLEYTMCTAQPISANYKNHHPQHQLLLLIYQMTTHHMHQTWLKLVLLLNIHYNNTFLTYSLASATAVAYNVWW